MSDMHASLTQLEEDGWRALATSGEAALAFYDRVLDREPVMLLPGGMRLADRDTVLESMGGQPWSSYALEELAVTELSPSAGVVHYGVTARRDGAEYSALVSSTYALRDDAWRLVLHQQTPR